MSKKKILVVDDSAPVRQQVGLVLSQAGFDVVEAFDGQDGFEKSRAGGFSMVVCDVNMPRLNGIQLLEKLGGKLPVLMLTTEGQAELKKQAKSLGARGWIIKPFVPELLVEAVRQLAGA